MAHNAPLPSNQLKSLQALRALAAISVVYYHIGCHPNFGCFGVDLFFVISGFVISWVAEGRQSPLQFFLNRMTRIMPLYWVLTTGLLILAILNPDLLNSTTANGSNYFKSLFFIPYYKENGVLHPMLAVGWTLNYEMLFYFCTVLGLVFTPKYLFFKVSAGILLLWGGSHLMPIHSPFHAFLSSALLFEFLLGMVVWKYRAFFLRSQLPWGVLLLVGVLAYVFMGYREIMGFSNRLLAFGIPSMIMLIAVVQLETAFLKLPERLVEWVVHIGDASFATYLSHLYVVELMRKIISIQFPVLAMNKPLGVMVALFASLAVGSLMYVGVDKQLVRISRAFIRRGLKRRSQVERKLSGA